MMQSIYSHRIMNENKNYGFVKTKPFKSNSKSSTCAIGIVNNQLQGQSQSNPIQNLSSIACPLGVAYLLFCRGSNFQTWG